MPTIDQSSLEESDFEREGGGLSLLVSTSAQNHPQTLPTLLDTPVQPPWEKDKGGALRRIGRRKT